MGLEGFGGEVVDGDRVLGLKFGEAAMRVLPEHILGM